MTSTANSEPCKLHPTRYVTMRIVPIIDYSDFPDICKYVNATVITKKQESMIRINRRLSGKDYTCNCPRCSTK